MSKITLLGLTALILLFAACTHKTHTDKANAKNNGTEIPKSTKMVDVPFIVAQNYFVKNTVKNLDNPKIETSEKFNQIFGTAARMGTDGKPTEIDFTKQNVIAIILPETNFATTLEPVSLQKNGNQQIIFTFKKVPGQKQTYTIRPSLEIVVDKSENGNILLKELK